MVALISLAAATMILAGCGGGGDGGGTTATTGSICGTIEYAATGEPLGGIGVSVGNISATTNDSGEFTLRRVPTGERTLEIDIPADRQLVVPPGVPLTVDVRGGEETCLSAPLQLVDDVDAPPAPPS
ncbi:MAG: hypothetical protein ACOCX2_02530 [Armatimonadota bacterium]